MKKVIVSDEICKSCLYGVTGDCILYEAFLKPANGRECTYYVQSEIEGVIEGKKLAGFLPLLYGMSNIDCFIYGINQGQKFLKETLWHKADEVPNTKHPLLVFNPNGDVALAFYDKSNGWIFDRHLTPSNYMYWLDIVRILPDWFSNFNNL